MSGYVWLNQTIYARRRRASAIAVDVPRFLARGYVSTGLAEAFDASRRHWRQDLGRTFIAGTDTPPPEANTVPLTEADFDSEEQRSAVMDPWHVTDFAGGVHPQWLKPTKTFDRKGRIAPAGLALSGSPVPGEIRR